jgi:hypothetical protein
MTASRTESSAESMGRVGTASRHSGITFAAGRTQVGARFIVPSSIGGRGEATPLPSAALRRPGRDGSPSRPFAKRVSYRHRFNGGLGEPALPKATPLHPIRFPVSP